MELEIGRDLRDEVFFKRARAGQRSGNNPQASRDLQAYLREFDPDWTRLSGSSDGIAVLKKENPPPPGRHGPAARYHLAEALIKSGLSKQGRLEIEDLLRFMSQTRSADKKLLADAWWLLVQSFGLPNVASEDLDRAVKTARDFLKEFPQDRRSVAAAYRIAETYHNRGRSEEALRAYEDFIEGRGYGLPDGPETARIDEEFRKSSAELKEEWRKQALYAIGSIQFDQKNMSPPPAAGSGPTYSMS